MQPQPYKLSAVFVGLFKELRVDDVVVRPPFEFGKRLARAHFRQRQYAGISIVARAAPIRHGLEQVAAPRGLRGILIGRTRDD